jgi:hypothetical protein
MSNPNYSLWYLIISVSLLAACQMRGQEPQLTSGREFSSNNVAVTLTATTAPRRGIGPGGFELRLNRLLHVDHLQPCVTQVSTAVATWIKGNKYSTITKVEGKTWLIIHVLPTDTSGFYEFSYKLWRDRAMISFVFCSASGEEFSPPLSGSALDPILETLESAIQCSNG